MVSTGASDPYRYGYYRYGAKPQPPSRSGRKQRSKAKETAGRH
jgi:hypothetical protein